MWWHVVLQDEGWAMLCSLTNTTHKLLGGFQRPMYTYFKRPKMIFLSYCVILQFGIFSGIRVVPFFLRIAWRQSIVSWPPLRFSGQAQCRQSAAAFLLRNSEPSIPCVWVQKVQITSFPRVLTCCFNTLLVCRFFRPTVFRSLSVSSKHSLQFWMISS